MAALVAAGPCLADDAIPDPITKDPSLLDNPPPIATFAGMDGFKSDSGAFYGMRGGATSSRTAGLGTSVGYNWKYFGGEITYDRTALSSAYGINQTGVKFYAQYPFDKLTPFVSIGMGSAFRSIGAWNAVSTTKTVGLGFNWLLTPMTDLRASADFTNFGNQSFFSRGMAQTYKVTITFRF